MGIFAFPTVQTRFAPQLLPVFETHSARSVTTKTEVMPTRRESKEALQIQRANSITEVGQPHFASLYNRKRQQEQGQKHHPLLKMSGKGVDGYLFTVYL